MSSSSLIAHLTNKDIAYNHIHPFLGPADLVHLAATCRKQERLVFSNDKRWREIARNMQVMQVALQPGGNAHALLVQHDYHQRLTHVKRVNGAKALRRLDGAMEWGAAVIVAGENFKEGNWRFPLSCAIAGLGVKTFHWIRDPNLQRHILRNAHFAFSLGALILMKNAPLTQGAIITSSSFSILINIASPEVTGIFLARAIGQVRAIPFRVSESRRLFIELKQGFFHRVDSFCRGGMFMKL